MRAIAREAGVDPALVSYYFGSKSGLFVESLRLPVNPADAIAAVLAEGTDDLGRRLVTRFLQVWDNPRRGEPVISVLRSVSSHRPELMREFLERQIVPRFARRDRRARCGAARDRDRLADARASPSCATSFAPSRSPRPSRRRSSRSSAPTLQRYSDG